METSERLTNAACPEDVFGALSGDKSVALRSEVRAWLMAVHPDKGGTEETFIEFQRWQKKAEEKIKAGTYGDRASEKTIITSKGDTYSIGSLCASGDIADVFHGKNEAGKRVVLKIVRNAANNDLMLAEQAALKSLKADLKAVKLHTPDLMDSFEVKQGGTKRRVNVFRWLEGYFTLRKVREAYRTGLDIRDAAWMWNRLLGALAGAHASGIVHGAVTPDNFMVCPQVPKDERHNGVLVDWCFAVKEGQKVKAMSPPWRDCYPQEIPLKMAVDPSTDIYMAAKCMIYLVAQNSSAIPRRINGLLQACLLAQRNRLSDAAEVHKEFSEILVALYGPRTFREFEMPPKAVSVS